MARFNLEPIAQNIIEQAAKATLNETNKSIVNASIQYLNSAQDDINHVDRYNKFLALQNARIKLERNVKIEEKIKNNIPLKDREKLLTNKQFNRYSNINSKYASIELNQAKEEILGDYYEKDIQQAFTNLTIKTQKYQQELLSIQKISMTTMFVIDVENTVIVYEETNETDLNKNFHMDRASDGGGLIARYNTAATALKDLYKSTTYSTNPEQNKDDYKRTLTEAYLVLLKRIEATKMSDNNKIFIPYKSGNEKKIAQISARGDLAEAYLKLLLNKSSSQSLDIDSAIEQLLLGTADVSSLSGMFVGDFEIERNNQKIQVAAKSLNASLMGYKQIIQFAKNAISYAASGKNDEVFKNLIKKKSSGGSKRNKLNVQIDKEIEQKIKEKLDKALNITSI